MICWLASYPRSGNTLLRIVLRQCFDIWSYGAVGEGDDASFDEIAGHLSYEGERAAFLRDRRRWPGMHFVKTHIDIPAIKDRAIYVVRDGRAAIASCGRYRRVHRVRATGGSNRRPAVLPSAARRTRNPSREAWT